MKVLTQPGKSYRRFRRSNRYDTPLLIFFMDTLIWLSKTLFVIALLAAVWIVVDKHRQSPAATEIAIGTTTDSSIKLVKASSREPALSTQLTAEDARPIVSTQNAHPTNAKLTTSMAGVKPIDSTPPKIKDEKWILGMRPSSYVVQFGSSTNTTLLKEFVPIINNGDPISIYPFKLTPSGRPVYGIASGIYNSLDAAQAAIETYSEQARAYKPWIRKVAILSGQIESVTTQLQNSQ